MCRATRCQGPRPSRSPNTHTLDVGRDGGLESLGVGTNDGGDHLTVLEEDEGGHGADVELLGDVGGLVDVDLVEAGLGVLVGVPAKRRISPQRLRKHLASTYMCARMTQGEESLLYKRWRNGLAGAAPCGEAIEDHEGTLLVHGGIELRLPKSQDVSFRQFCSAWVQEEALTP